MSEDSHLSDEARKQADIIFRQAQKLKQLIADLNLTSKLEYAMQPLKLDKLDILELIRQVVTDFLNNGWDEKYKIEFENEIVEDQIPIYWGDASLLKRMFTNLVQNSILHNPNGCNIKLTLAETKEAYHFVISDNGIGILEEKRNQLNQGIDFTGSYLENGENVHGFGLKLVRQIVKAHEGQIFFEKNVPDGLCVKITLLKNWASETE